MGAKEGLMGIVSYKLTTTNDLLTPNAGLLCLAELLEKLDFSDRVNRHFSLPKSNRGFLPSVFVNSLIFMLHRGGHYLDDIRLLSSDKALRQLLEWNNVPAADSVGDWLRRQGQSGVKAVSKLLSEMVAISLGGCREVTLDIDATLSPSNHKTAEWTYKSCKGYMPMVGTIAEISQILAVDFRAGNVAPATKNFEFIEQCKDALPRGFRIKGIRSDAAGYQHKIIDQCIEEDIEFAIRAKMSKELKTLIRAQSESAWQGMIDQQGEAIADEATCRLVHAMHNSCHAFEIVVQRRKITDQTDLPDSDEEVLSHNGYIYRAIATNSKHDNSQLVHWYNARAEDAENRIKELKADFGAERMPCRDFNASALYFSLCALAYNIFALLRTFLPNGMHCARAKRVRLILYNTAAKLVKHARQIILKVEKTAYNLIHKLIKDIRCFTFST